MGVHLLESCLVTKIDIITKDTPCFKKEFTSKFIKKAKSCTYKDLKGSRQGPDDNDIHVVDENIAVVMQELQKKIDSLIE